MWSKKKRSKTKLDPQKEICDLFKNMESWREIVRNSHQTVALVGSDMGAWAWTPEADDLVKFRTLVAKALSAPLAPTPPLRGLEPVGIYCGFFIVDPFADRLPLTMEDIPDFSPPYPFSNVYMLIEGTIRLQDEKEECHEARELEEWLKKKWISMRGSLATDL